jgi:hypothetical protein
MDVVVTEVKADFDPWGGEYTHVSFAYRIPVPAPPVPAGVTVVGQPKNIAYKHALHVIIPKDKWLGQYMMWEHYHFIVEDDGKIQLKKAEAQV